MSHRDSGRRSKSINAETMKARVVAASRSGWMTLPINKYYKK